MNAFSTMKVVKLAAGASLSSPIAACGGGRKVES